MSVKRHVTFKYPPFTTAPPAQNYRHKVDNTSGHNPCGFGFVFGTQNQNDGKQQRYLRQNKEFVLVEKHFIRRHLEKANQI